LRDRADRTEIAVIVALAMTLRLVFFYLNRAHNPVFYHPILDALYHNDWALDILKGPAHGKDVFFRGPLYPYVLAGLYWIGHSSIAFAVFVQHLMGTATVILTWWMAREFLEQRVALAAGIVAALYWPFVYFEGDLLIVTMFMMVNGAGLLVLVRALRTDSRRAFALAGVLFGLAAIARPSILIFFPALPLVCYLANRGPRRAWLRHSAIIALAAAVPIAPVMIRNGVVGHAVVPIAASGGVNFYIGNNPSSDGSTAIVPGTRADWWGGYHDAIHIAERDEGHALSLPQVSHYYFRRGVNFILTRPADSWPLMGKKFLMFWAGPERANNKFIYFFWDLAGMKYVPLPGYWIVAPFALLGMVVLWPRRRKFAVLYLFVGLYMLGVVAFFVNARFRLPVVPVLIVFAACGGAYVVAAWRSRSFMLVRAIIVLAAASLFVNADFIWFRQIRAYATAASHNALGNAYLQMGLDDTALTQFQLADQINKEHPTDGYAMIARYVNYNMGCLLWKKGLCSRAIDVLQKVGGNDVFAVTALDHLGDCYLRRQMVGKALGAWERIVHIDKKDARGVTGVARCYAAAGKYDEAEKMLTAIVDPSQSVFPPAYIALAEVWRAQGRLDEAISAYIHITHFVGYEKRAYMALIELYQQKGDRSAALDSARSARPFFTPGDPTYNALLRSIRTGK